MSKNGKFCRLQLQKGKKVFSSIFIACSVHKKSESSYDHISKGSVQFCARKKIAKCISMDIRCSLLLKSTEVTLRSGSPGLLVHCEAYYQTHWWDSK